MTSLDGVAHDKLYALASYCLTCILNHICAVLQALHAGTSLTIWNADSLILLLIRDLLNISRYTTDS